MEKFHKRLAVARKKTSYSQKRLAEKLGIAESTMNNWEQGKRFPDSNYLSSICKLINVSADWLLTGEGEMVQTDPNEKSESRNTTREDDEMLKDELINTQRELIAANKRIKELEAEQDTFPKSPKKAGGDQ